MSSSPHTLQARPTAAPSTDRSAAQPELARELWVLGHRIRRLDTDPGYGLIEVTSPPQVPGPPPHQHPGAREFFLIVKGELEVMAHDAWRTLREGEFLELPPATPHTFINRTEHDVVWLTGWRPGGFERFFRDFGIPVDVPAAQERSVEPQLLRRVAAECPGYGMVIVGK